MNDQMERYLHELDAALTGSAQQRARIIEEAREHLLDTMERHESAGSVRGESAATAIKDFGPVAVIAFAFAPKATAARLGAAIYLHLALLVSTALMTIGAVVVAVGAIGVTFGLESVSGEPPAFIDGARCAQLGVTEPGATDCQSAWSWHFVEESVLYRGLPGVFGAFLAMVHILLARRYLPRASWTRRMTRIALLIGVIAFGAAGLTFGYTWTVLDADAAPFGPSRVGGGWWASLLVACAMTISAGLLAYQIARRRSLLTS